MLSLSITLGAVHSVLQQFFVEGRKTMATLKMSWKTDQGRLECRWVESQESEKFDADLMWLALSRVSCGKGTRSYVALAQMTNLVTLYNVPGGSAQASNPEHRRSICQSLHRM